MSFDFSDVPLLFSICFLVTLSFGGNFSFGSPKVSSRSCLELVFSPRVLICLTRDRMVPTRAWCLVLSAILFKYFIMQSTFSCLQDPCGFNQRTIFKSK